MALSFERVMKREMFLVVKLHGLQITYKSVTSNPNIIRQN